FEAELALDSRHAQAVAYLGDLEMKNNHPDAALVLLRKAVALKNDIRIAYIDIGAILAEKKQYAESARTLKRAVELAPKQSDAHYRLGNIYKAMGEKELAQREFAKVRELQENPEEDLVRKMSSSPPSLGGEAPKQP